MNDFCKIFNCNNKEELLEKINNELPEIQPLLDFFSFMSFPQKINNKTLTSPESAVEYASHLKPPTKHSINAILTDTKMSPIEILRFRIDRKSEIQNLVKTAIRAGASNIFLASSWDSPEKNIDEVKEIFFSMNINIPDNINLMQNNVWYSTKGDRNINMSENDNLYTANNDEAQCLVPLNDYSKEKGYIDFARYYASTNIKGLDIINNKNEIHNYLKLGYQHQDREIVSLIAYDNNNKIIDIEDIFLGGISSSVADPRVIIKKLLEKESVKGFALSHNHPSGDTYPSDADISITQKIKNAAGFLDIEYLDHYIIGKEKVLSLASYALSNNCPELFSNNKEYTNKCLKENKYINKNEYLR